MTENVRKPTLRRLDHVAVGVHDTERALLHFRDRLGLAVMSSEELERPRVRLTYLDAGNVFIQLVEPLDDTTDIARHLAEHGEGLHHICFGVDDVLQSARSLAEGSTPDPVAGSGRGRMSAFVRGRAIHGVRVECTEFDYQADVVERTGWLAD